MLGANITEIFSAFCLDCEHIEEQTPKLEQGIDSLELCLSSSTACEVIITFVATGVQQSFTVTLGDFAIKPFEL
jgi:hypothetical protein